MPSTAPRFILASASPRRRQLLAEAGFRFEVVRPETAELLTGALSLRELTCCNAVRKGLAVARAHPAAVVLAADTLVALDEEVIGKPASIAEAREMLRRLSGRTHQVATGVFIAHLSRGRSETFSEMSHVTFKELNDATIADYFAKINPLDKAGGYAAQGEGRIIIRRITGSRSNVIGLPLEKTRAALARFGVRPASSS